jgi:hypothetical protein
MPALDTSPPKSDRSGQPGCSCLLGLWRCKIESDRDGDNNIGVIKASKHTDVPATPEIGNFMCVLTILAHPNVMVFMSSLYDSHTNECLMGRPYMSVLMFYLLK